MHACGAFQGGLGWVRFVPHLAEVMKRALEDEGDEDDDGAHGRQDPCRRVLQRRLRHGRRRRRTPSTGTGTALK